MALQNIDPTTGTMTWVCAGRGGACGTNLTAHISDPGVEWVASDAVALPPCSVCGALCTLKVSFTQEELASMAVQTYATVPQPMTVQLADDPSQTVDVIVPVLVPATDPGATNPYADRHQTLAQLLTDSGKVYTPPTS